MTLNDHTSGELHSPRQLPPVPVHFIRGTDELARLDTLVTGQDGEPQERASVAVVVGPGGIGKTALAVTWASKHAHRFPDGQLYADLRGFSSDSALPPQEVLGRFLRALGVAPEQVPATLDEQVGLYRTLTAGRRLLLVVVLDNAVSADQVRPLIPTSAGCVVVVTSRLRLDGLVADGAQYVAVPPLTQPDAVALLARLVGDGRADSERASLEQLAELCGRFPVTLRVAAACLATRRRWTVWRLVAQLRREQSRLAALGRLSGEADPVTVTFDWSYHALPPDVAAVYRLLAEIPGPEFGIELAAAVVQLADQEMDVALQVLVDASLLEEVDNDRYRFHDLVRLHARAQHDPQRDEVVARAAAWYLRQMTRANLVIIPQRWRVSPVADHLRDEPAHFASDGAALNWLARELPSVLAILEEAVADRHDEVSWQLCEALWELLLYRKHYPEWLRSHALGITAARRCSNQVAESRLRYQLGRARLDLGQWDLAEQETQAAVELACAASDRRNESAALQQLGVIALARGETDPAIALITTSLDIEAELGIDRGVASRHLLIGDALQRARRDAEARHHLLIALRMLTAIEDDKGQARAAVRLAQIDARAGRHTLAEQRLTQARRVLSRTGSRTYESEVLIASAAVAEEAGDLDRARSHLTEAINLLQELGGAALDRAQAALHALDHADEPDTEGLTSR
ncbi:ATP-binding protein [Amycolatopsis sp. cmx-4-61]|uniref:ATP-binding protein n=1 Tax=Amycolatopsis sp. cmx-4-61 TaxID=2790937 RepID=UPI003978001C